MKLEIVIFAGIQIRIFICFEIVCFQSIANILNTND